MLDLVWRCLRSPKLFKIYADGPIERQYYPYALELVGDKIITAANTVLSIGTYTSPFICMYVYKRGFLSWEETSVLAHLVSGVGCIVAIAYLMRGIGRASNPKYVEFLTNYNHPEAEYNTLRYADRIRQYDFDFKYWPAVFAMPQRRRQPWYKQHPFRRCANPDLPFYQRVPLQLLAFIATHTFALRLIYPGSLNFVQNILWYPLFQGRSTLVVKHGGQRGKIVTRDGNSIDTMLIDNREKGEKGRYLVICCEGNSGFYEIGITATPLKANYSVLGWNHPGFGNSTGRPLPEQVRNAIDAVVNYAINSLYYDLQDMFIFGWSIGGYPAAWAAVRYPGIRGLVLDATFDDILPLAANQMPKSWYPLVKEVIRSYVDLNVAGLLKYYIGPIQIVRRVDDEIICTRPGLISTNRGNDLLYKLLEMRHSALTQVPENSELLKKLIALTEIQRIVMSRSPVTENEERMLKLISRYMRDYRSTHCAPLPSEMLDTIVYGLCKTFNQLYATQTYIEYQHPYMEHRFRAD